MKKVYDTANFYHFVHTMALLAVPLTRRPALVSIHHTHFRNNFSLLKHGIADFENIVVDCVKLNEAFYYTFQ